MTMRGMTQAIDPGAEIRIGSRPGAAGIIRCPTNDAPEHVRPALLCDFFGRLGINYHVQPEGNAPVEIDLTIRALPGLQIMSGRMQGARYRRTRESSDATEDVGVVVNP